MKGLLSLYSRRYAVTLVYMLQSVEYQAGPFLRWYWRVVDFRTVMHRRTLRRTKAARLLLLALHVGMGMQALAGGALLGAWAAAGTSAWLSVGPQSWLVGVALILTYPLVWAHVVIIPLWLGRMFIIRPRQRRAVRRSEKIFAAHPGVRIAIAGSYGKTSMKELLGTVLGGAKKVAATPGNMNVGISHARFAASLQGDEDVLLIEYGEGQPGDIAAFARQSHPTHGVITGLAPAHLDRYKTLAAAAKDIFSLGQYVPDGQLYVNADSLPAKDYITDGMQTYDSTKALGWKVGGIKVSLLGTHFQLSQGKRKLKLHSGLLGRHQVGPLAFAAALALDLGLKDKQVIAGIAKTVPYEHRMQPYRLNGAWIIDDTYNGNLEGVRAGTALLGELPAERKWYISPGLVDQGRETWSIHRQMGQLIAEARPDHVVLMDNSVTEAIIAGLHDKEFAGELRIVEDPLHFYTNLQHFVAAGDVVLMQNDWTDNYA